VPSSRNSLVMVVDDAPQNIKLMRAALAHAGYNVLEAVDGATALALALASPPDLILLDVRMPGMDGFEVCARLKAQEATRHIPVIFMTASNDEEEETRCFKVGAADFITKPVMLPTALARVQAHLKLHNRQRRLEGMFQDVVELAPDAFILSDAQGVIQRINAHAEQLFGYPREELVGTPLARLLPLHQSASATTGANAETRPLDDDASAVGVRKNGDRFPAEVNQSPIQTPTGLLSMAVVRDVTERRQAQRALSASRQQLRALAAQNEAARETERKHVAREVHDELGQLLTGMRMELSLLEMRFGPVDPLIGAKVKDMKLLVDQAIQGVRNVAISLRPAALDMGLVPAIEWLCADITRRTGMVCQLRLGAGAIALSDERAVVVFRIVQESLTNASRYAGGKRVEIDLSCDDDLMRLEIRDDGRGFDLATQAKRHSFGLLGMHERALALGGQLNIASAPGAGTAISVRIPLQNPADQDVA
jgi:PAS domain S-box-containing protein